ncbi:MAG: IgA Peptidase M64 [Prevotellaceae bacterium]|nr:IgA Peptidase M64 [Prevotellaceae bacterium]
MLLCAQEFDTYFDGRTLRVDYAFCSDITRQHIYVDALSQSDGWAGRKHNLSSLPLQGNGQISMRDADSNTIIYRTSFSALFLEWLNEDEAKTTPRSFENVFLLPMPKQTAWIDVTLLDAHHDTIATLSHRVDPKDILIRRIGNERITTHKYLEKNGDVATHIDVAILAEGYTENEMNLFLADAEATCEALFSHEPFRTMRERFNIVAVCSPSEDSGVSIPRKGEWKSTAVDSHFDTFYSARYLTTPHVKAIHDELAGIPYEHIIILANTNTYGGGGIYNSYTLTTAHHAQFKPVVVHEFGHSFGGLGDEYYYPNDIATAAYPLDVEPWEQNITTRVNFASKWEDMMDVPGVGLFKGGGYSADVYRPADDCRMRTNTASAFCPVCQRALRRMIEFYTE